MTITIKYPWFGWQPTGRRLLRLEELRNGMSVQAIGYVKISKKKIKEGTIQFEYEPWLDGGASVYLKDLNSDFKAHLGYLEGTGQWDKKHDSMHAHRIYVHNKLKENTTMANKLMALVKLNKNQRKLAKAGIYDENGNLTVDGQEVLLNMLAKDHEDKLVELVKDFKTDKKDDDK